jgi:hypothetical protein
VLGKLIIIERNKEPRTLEFNEPRTLVIGRSFEADLVIPDPELSRRHCEINISKAKSEIRDLGSKNGIFIGSDRIEGSVLNHGAVVRLGTTLIRFESPLGALADMATVQSGDPLDMAKPHSATTRIGESAKPAPPAAQTPFTGEPEAYCRDCKAPITYGMIARRLAWRSPEGAYLCKKCHETMLAQSIAEICYGRYRIDEKLADEAAGAVYRATDMTNNNVVALKVVEFPPDLGDPELRQKLIEKAGAASSFVHPNIIRLLDVGESDGRILCAMELVDGQNVLDRIKKRGRMHPTEASRIGLDIALALKQAFTNGVTHCDVTPGSIFITSEGQTKLVCVGFSAPMIGVAVSGSRDDKYAAAICYSAPEILEDPMRSDPQTLVYAIAATLYHLVTGRSPFRAVTASACIQKIRDVYPVPPISLNQRVPPLLNDIILRGMEKDPHRRYETLGALARDLKITIK